MDTLIQVALGFGYVLMGAFVAGILYSGRPAAMGHSRALFVAAVGGALWPACLAIGLPIFLFGIAASIGDDIRGR